jgi:hypothetical protein
MAAGGRFHWVQTPKARDGVRNLWEAWSMVIEVWSSVWSFKRAASRSFRMKCF